MASIGFFLFPKTTESEINYYFNSDNAVVFNGREWSSIISNDYTKKWIAYHLLLNYRPSYMKNEAKISTCRSNDCWSTANNIITHTKRLTYLKLNYILTWLRSDFFAPCIIMNVVHRLSMNLSQSLNRLMYSLWLREICLVNFHSQYDDESLCLNLSELDWPKFWWISEENKSNLVNTVMKL